MRTGMADGPAVGERIVAEGIAGRLALPRRRLSRCTGSWRSGSAARTGIRSAGRTGRARRRRSTGARDRRRAPAARQEAPPCRDGVDRRRARDRRLLDLLAGVEHRDPFRRLRHDAHVVGDQDQRHAGLLLQVEQEVEDLRLDGHVERRGRLVGDDRASDCRRAPWRSSPAGSCRRKAGAGRRTAAARDRICRRRAGVPPSASRRSALSRPRWTLERLADLIADREARIQAGHRLLEDHRHVLADDLPALGAASGRGGRGRRTPGVRRSPSPSTAAVPSPPALPPTCRNRTRRRSPEPRPHRRRQRHESTARKAPWAVAKSTDRLRISRSATSAPPEFWIEGIAEPVADQVDGEDRDQDGQSGKRHHPPGSAG